MITLFIQPINIFFLVTYYHWLRMYFKIHNPQPLTPHETSSVSDPHFENYCSLINLCREFNGQNSYVWGIGYIIRKLVGFTPTLYESGDWNVESMGQLATCNPWIQLFTGTVLWCMAAGLHVRHDAWPININDVVVLLLILHLL
jgi:hypothetical protein